MARLTKKRKGFARDYAITGNGSLSAKKNFDVTTDESARAVASRALASANVIEEVERVGRTLAAALEERGVTSDKLALKIDQLLDSDEYQAVDKGITHAAKIGVGGGYAPEKAVSLHVEARLDG